MCKKLAVVALLVAAGVVAYKKLDIRCCRKDESPEAKIQRLRAELATTDNEISKNIHHLAVRDEEIDQEEKQLKAIRTRQDENKKVILARQQELKADTAFVKTGGKVDPDRAAAERELGRLVGAYKRCAEELKVRQKKLDAMKQAREAAAAKLDAYMAQREELGLELTRLDAQLTELRAEEIKSQVHFDASRLGRIKKATAELRKDINVRAREHELQGRYLGKSEQPAAQPKQTDVLKEVDDLFGNK